ncbi:hypothetical protein C2845_PM16G05800 [Panicum miliaceum]|uniref:Uncharacterized protein n=1 Tax=Panicum miliaceum TaxID=4540 RepID=A0A3L6PYE6_PANMI|nr:hypothetical protein C2845_PM16G05800 [Panicum miliaceum]
MVADTWVHSTYASLSLQFRVVVRVVFDQNSGHSQLLHPCSLQPGPAPLTPCHAPVNLRVRFSTRSNRDPSTPREYTEKHAAIAIPIGKPSAIPSASTSPHPARCSLATRRRAAALLPAAYADT